MGDWRGSAAAAAAPRAWWGCGLQVSMFRCCADDGAGCMPSHSDPWYLDGFWDCSNDDGSITGLLVLFGDKRLLEKVRVCRLLHLHVNVSLSPDSPRRIHL
jgi:hypothetical protein